MRNEYVDAYYDAVFDTDRDTAFDVVRRALEDGFTPEQVVFDLVIPSVERMMALVTEDFDTNLAQHFLSAQIASEVTEDMVARFERAPDPIGTVIIGTSHGDLHTLGKRIVGGCLRTWLVDVVDIGVNVPAERFVDEALARNADVIAVSSMMVHTARSERGALAVRRLLAEKGLENRVKIVVGGAPYRFDPELYAQVGADAWASDGVSGARVIRDLIAEVRS